MALKGNRLSLFVEQGEMYKPVGMAMDSSLTINGEVIELASLSSRARSFAAGRYEWRISCSALYCADPTAATYAQQLHILTTLLQGKTLRVVYTEVASYDRSLYEVSLPAVQYIGDVIVTGYTINAPVQGYANISIELQGTGEIDVAELDVVDGGEAATRYAYGSISGGDSATEYTNTIEGGQSI